MTADTQVEEADAEERKRSRLGNRRLRELLVDDADDRGSGRAKIERYILYHTDICGGFGQDDAGGRGSRVAYREMTDQVTVGEIEDVLRDARYGSAVELHRGVMEQAAGDVPTILKGDVFRCGPGVEGGLDPDAEISIRGIRRAHGRMGRDIDLGTGEADASDYVARSKIVERFVPADDSGTRSDRDGIGRSCQANHRNGNPADLLRASVITTPERAHTLSPSSERSGSSNPAEECKLQSIRFQINTVTKIYRSTNRSAVFSFSGSVGL
jgi:hypothetical protein